MDLGEAKRLVDLGGPDRPDGLDAATWNVARNQVEAARRARYDDGGEGQAMWIKIAVLGVVISGAFLALRAGMVALANSSALAALFPRQGDSLARYTIAVVTLWILVPGPLVAIAAWLRGRRLAVLRRVLLPLAAVTTLAIPIMTTATSTALVSRLPS
jgi:hypothetical protein